MILQEAQVLQALVLRAPTRAMRVPIEVIENIPDTMGNAFVSRMSIPRFHRRHANLASPLLMANVMSLP